MMRTNLLPAMRPITGSTRVFAVLGDPVAQVQAPLPLPAVTHEHVRGGDYYGATSAAEVNHAA